MKVATTFLRTAAVCLSFWPRPLRQFLSRCDRRRPTTCCSLLTGLFLVQSFGIICLLLGYRPSHLVSLFFRPSDAECRKLFLAEYEDYCKQCLRPLPTNFLNNVENVVDDHLPLRTRTNLCPCIPQMEAHAAKIDYNSTISWDEMLRRHSVTTSSPHDVTATMSTSGRWYPTSCIPRHRIALILSFSSNREDHLLIFINNIHPFLRRQLLDYTIIVIEQLQPEKFNRGALLNVGYLEAKSRAAASGGQYDCFIFHDVDLFPEDGHNFYVCSQKPRHMAAYRLGWNYDLLYNGFFGGVTSFRGDHFEMINGFSNKFFGWGGEDDDLFNRVLVHGLQVDSRYPKCVSKYGEKQHQRDQRNPVGRHKNDGRYYLSVDEYQRDGLNSVNYTVVSYQERSLYTRISVKLLYDAAHVIRMSPLLLFLAVTASILTTEKRPTADIVHIAR